MANGKKIKILILIELIVIALLAGVIILTHSRLFYDIPVRMNDWQSWYIEYSGTDWHVDRDQIAVEGDSIDLIYGPYMALESGHYTLDIWYDCETSQGANLFAGNGNDVFLESSQFPLEKNLTHEAYDFSVTEDIDNFEVQVKYNGQGNFTISKIQITHNDLGVRLALLLLVLGFGVLDFCLLHRGFSEDVRFGVWVVLAATFASSLPLLFRGVNEGHDMIFHLMRIEGLVQEIREGHFPVRVASLWMGGYGYPTSIFYGDVLLYFPAALRLMGVSVYSAYKIYVLVINLLTAWIGYVCFGRMFGSRKIGAICTFVFLTAPYRLVDVYVRSAVGEYSVILFFPLIAYAIWNIYYAGCNETWKENVKNGLLLAIGMSGIITSHVLTSEMMCVAILVVFVARIRKSVSVPALRTYAVGAVGSLLLSAYFIVPFVDYYVNVPVYITSSVAGAVSKKVQGSGLSPAEYFAFFNNPFGWDQQMLCTPGIVLMGVLVCAVILWIRRKASATVKVLTVSSVIMLVLASDVFPWNSLAYRFGVFNLLAQVQFPWRFVIQAILFLTVLLGCVLQEGLPEGAFSADPKVLGKWAVVISAGMVLVFASFYEDYAGRAKYYDTYNINTYYYSGGEYLRTNPEKGIIIWTDVSRFNGRFDAGTAESLKVVDRKGTDFDLECRTGLEESRIVAPILNYKGYTVFDDAGNTYEISDSDNYQVSFVLPAGFNGNLYIRFIDPWYWTAALGFSAVGWLLVIGGLAWVWYHSRVCETENA